MKPKIPEVTMEGEITKLEEKKTTSKSGMKKVGKITIETGCGHKIVIESGPEILKGKDRGHNVEIVMRYPQTTLDDLKE